MRVAVLEMPARFGDVAGQIRWLDQVLARVQAEVVLLPEASLTGYVSAGGNFDRSPFAEPIDVGPLSVAMATRARRHQIFLGWPLIERDPAGRCFNTYVVHGPEGLRLARYRKRHPWFPELWATPGDEPHPVFSLGELRATIAICYDVHFLAKEAARELEEADLLLFPSAWVEFEGDDDIRRPLFFDLARRFRLSIANPNWGSGDVRLHGQGGSRLVSPDGREIVRDLEGPYAVGAVRRP